MKKNLRNIKDVFEHYSLDYLNCFEHPTTILYRYIKPRSESMYLISCKLLSVYGTMKERKELYDFSKETGVQCVEQEVQGDLIESIKSLLVQDIPVLVPCNLITIFYSQFYREKDWGHLLLVKGFDDSKELFYILDHTHVADDGLTCKYTEFAIKYEDLIESFQQFLEDYYSNKIYYLKIIDDNEAERIKVIRLLEKLYENIKNQNNIEKHAVTYLKDPEKKGETIPIDKQNMFQNFILNIPKYKKVILNEVIQLMKVYSFDSTTLQSIMEPMIKSWKNDNTRFIKRMFNEDKSFKYECSDHTNLYENKLLKEIKNFIDYLHSNDYCDSNNNVCLPCENNEDNLISMQNNSYIFRFDTGKLYNSWLGDNCPKVVLYQGNQQQTEYVTIRTKIIIQKDCDQQGYDVGIYIRTENDELYLFGLDYRKLLLFDLIGVVNLKSYDINFKGKEIELQIEQKDNTIIMGIVSLKQGFTKLGSYHLNNKIKQAGICCKTYDTCKDLIVCFSDTKVITNKSN